MSDKNKSFGERVGETIDKAKDAAQDTLSGADEKRKEAGDRTDANVRDAKAETSDNPLDKAGHKIAGGVDRAEAEGHSGKAEHHEERAKNRVKRD